MLWNSRSSRVNGVEMNISDLVRYKGVLISTALLLAIVFLFALANLGLQKNSLQSSSTLQAIESLEVSYSELGGAPASRDLASWEETLSADQRVWLEKVGGNELSAVRDAVVQNNSQNFLAAMANLKKVLAAEVSKRGRLLNIAPIAVCILALLIYLLAVIPQLLRLSRDTEVQVESNQQAENILNTVSEGLFLLDKEGQIGVEQSKSLKQMFRLERDLEGSFLDFIGQYVPESSVSVAKDYLDLLYGDRVKEKLVKDLNPLNQVEINITRRDGSVESRFLDFKFARVMVDSELQHLLGSVTDVTREVQLEKELESNKEEQEAQLDLLMNILHLDKDSLARFYSETDTALNSINSTLQERGHSTDEIRSKLATIAEQAHRIKGDAAALKLHNFEFIMHEFETEVGNVQAIRGTISGRDVLPAVTKLKAVFKELNNMQSIVTRFSEVLSLERSQDDQGSADVTAVKPTAVDGGSVLEQELQDLVSSIAERNQVRVVLKTFGLGATEVPEYLTKVVRDSAIQMLRNSVAHGARPPAQRLASGKPDYMTVTVSLTPTPEGHTFMVRDDGEGLDQQKILDKAVKKGLIKETDLAKVTSAVLGRLIFHPGFSTRDEADLDAGRGVGLSAVHSMIRDAGGVLGFAQSAGKHCQFSVRFN